MPDPGDTKAGDRGKGTSSSGGLKGGSSSKSSSSSKSTGAGNKSGVGGGGGGGGGSTGSRGSSTSSKSSSGGGNKTGPSSSLSAPARTAPSAAAPSRAPSAPAGGSKTGPSGPLSAPARTAPSAAAGGRTGPSSPLSAPARTAPSTGTPNKPFTGFGPRADSPQYSVAPTAGLGTYVTQPKDQSRVPEGIGTLAATPEQYSLINSYNTYVTPAVDSLTEGANSPFADPEVTSYNPNQTFSVPSPMAGSYNPLDSISTPETIATAKFANDMYADPTLGNEMLPTGRAFNTGVPVSQEEKLAGGVSGIMAAATPVNRAPTVGISNLADPNNIYAGGYMANPNARWNSLASVGNLTLPEDYDNISVANPPTVSDAQRFADSLTPTTPYGPSVDRFSFADPDALARGTYNVTGIEAPTPMGAMTRLTERELLGRTQTPSVAATPQTLDVTDNYPVRTAAAPAQTLDVTDNYPVRTDQYDVVDSFSQEGNYPTDVNPSQDDGLIDLPDPTEPTIGYVGPVYPGEEDGIYGRNPTSWAGGHSTQFNVVPTSGPPPSNPNPGGGGGGGGQPETPWFDSSYNNPAYVTEVRAPTITTLAPVSTGVGGLLPNAQFVVVDPFTGQAVNR